MFAILTTEPYQTEGLLAKINPGLAQVPLPLTGHRRAVRVGGPATVRCGFRRPLNQPIAKSTCQAKLGHFGGN